MILPFTMFSHENPLVYVVGAHYGKLTFRLFVAIKVGQKYRYAGIPRYFFGVVRTAAHLSIPQYSGVSIVSNRKL